MGVDGSGLVEEITDSPAGMRGSATVTIEKGHGLALNRTFVSSLRVLGGHAPGSVPPVGGGMRPGQQDTGLRCVFRRELHPAEDYAGCEG